MVRDGDTGQIALSHADVSPHLPAPPVSPLHCCYLGCQWSEVREVSVSAVYGPQQKCRRAHHAPLSLPQLWQGLQGNRLGWTRLSANDKIFFNLQKTSHLRAHLRWHIGDQPYLCSWPGKFRLCLNTLLEQRFVCRLLQEIYQVGRTSQALQDTHRREETQVAQTLPGSLYSKQPCPRCEHCGKSFSRSDHLKKHALSHHNNLNSHFDDNDNDNDADMETVIDPTQLLEVGYNNLIIK